LVPTRGGGTLPAYFIWYPRLSCGWSGGIWWLQSPQGRYCGLHCPHTYGCVSVCGKRNIRPLSRRIIPS